MDPGLQCEGGTGRVPHNARPHRPMRKQREAQLEATPQTPAGNSKAQNTAREVADQASGVAETVGAQGQDMASTAVEGAKWVGATAQDGVSQVVDSARQQLHGVTDEVTTQAKDLLEESRNQLRSQADGQLRQAATSLRTLEHQLTALLDGRPAEAGALRDYGRQASERLNGLAGQLENRGLNGLVSDVQNVARRRPGLFLLGAAVAGFAVTRVLRQANAASPTSKGTSGIANGAASLPSPMMTPQLPPMAPVPDATARLVPSVPTQGQEASRISGDDAPDWPSASHSTTQVGRP